MPSIAIIGASNARHKFGNKCVRAYLRAGFAVYPVHPTATQIEDCAVFPSIAHIPVPHLDRVSLYLPPEIGLTILPELAQHSIGELWLNPGSDSAELRAEAERLPFPVIVGCSILAVGYSPAEFPDQ